MAQLVLYKKNTSSYDTRQQCAKQKKNTSSYSVGCNNAPNRKLVPSNIQELSHAIIGQPTVVRIKMTRKKHTGMKNLSHHSPPPRNLHLCKLGVLPRSTAASTYETLKSTYRWQKTNTKETTWMGILFIAPKNTWIWFDGRRKLSVVFCTASRPHGPLPLLSGRGFVQSARRIFHPRAHTLPSRHAKNIYTKTCLPFSGTSQWNIQT